MFRQLMREWLWISLLLLPLTALLSFSTQPTRHGPGAALLSVFVVAVVLGLLLLRPRLALWTTVGGMSMALLISVVLGAKGWWWSPMAIGRGACRERGGQYGEISVVG